MPRLHGLPLCYCILLSPYITPQCSSYFVPATFAPRLNRGAPCLAGSHVDKAVASYHVVHRPSMDAEADQCDTAVDSVAKHAVLLQADSGESSNGRTADSGSASWGSNPCSPAPALRQPSGCLFCFLLPICSLHWSPISICSSVSLSAWCPWVSYTQASTNLVRWRER